jgi:hypothetical protein
MYPTPVMESPMLAILTGYTYCKMHLFKLFIIGILSVLKGTILSTTANSNAVMIKKVTKNMYLPK